MIMQFRIQAAAEAQCLPRLIDHFAQRGLIPSALSTTHVGCSLEIIIEHPTLDAETADLICLRMARIVSVQRASVSRRLKD